MNEYALLIGGLFQEIRWYDERPPNLPHKNATWHDVLREFGSSFQGIVDDVWVIRTPDPATLPPPVPEMITRRQCALQLLATQYITPTEALAMTKSAEVPAAISAIFDQAVGNGAMTADQRILAEIDFAAVNYYRSNSLLNFMGLTEEQIDQFFVSAGNF